MNEHDTTGIEDLYETGPLMCANKAQFDYRGWTLEKVEWPHPEHTEFRVFNPDGTLIESLTLSSYGSQAGLSIEQVISMMDKLADVDPESRDEWRDWNRTERTTR